MCRATSVANASSELRRAYSRTRTMSSVGILPIHLRRREKVTDYFYGRPTGNCFLTRRRFIDAARVNERGACLDARACSHTKNLLASRTVLAQRTLGTTAEQ